MDLNTPAPSARTSLTTDPTWKSTVDGTTSGVRDVNASSCQRTSNAIICHLCEFEVDFPSQSDLEEHQRTHDARDEECFSCYRVFGSFSAMLIHFETGTCSKGVDLSDIHEMALSATKPASTPGTKMIIFHTFALVLGVGASSDFLSSLSAHGD
ncbi:uncharacterized protein P174DRAFT_419702 [Aspergillus novofumigatus IBT 16806]|uniref:C2H2-type domain-containing protein n=1 Tax=Aspergillus novofumigatus (strain IBT 16806) TaxID=1392255 RepID=A0A2I1CDU4_ASPN1|nr:uncharacterized protein P174DRAFT_419702 [Aspergillus novofumigatus IBT 16806]PKX95799.1 hypothetical protein P174DRAFT_419702 [Aspergillus novofumigatus IBT 16806]